MQFTSECANTILNFFACCYAKTTPIDAVKLAVPLGVS